MKREFDRGSSEGQGKRPKIGSDGESNAPNRTLYLGNLHPHTSIADICDIIKDGPLDQVHQFPSKSCAFVSFLTDAIGVAAHARIMAEKPVIHGKPVVLGWGTPRAVPEKVAAAVAAGACRNVYIGGSVDRTSEEYLREALTRFGAIDCIDMLPAKKIAFVHFASIAAAMACKDALSADPQWSMFRLSYGKDRCCPDGKSKSHGASKLGASTFKSVKLEPFFSGRPLDRLAPLAPLAPMAPLAPERFGHNAFPSPPPSRLHADEGIRTVYLGGYTPDIPLQNVLGQVNGMLDQVKVLPEKKCCFLSFVDAQGARTFFAKHAHGLTVNGQLLKVGWGKATPLSSAVADALRRGASRAVFIGNCLLPSEQLQSDLSIYGPIEKVDILPAKKIAFVHFLSISAAQRCLEELKLDPRLREVYGQCRFNYGKDRCTTGGGSRPSHGELGISADSSMHGGDSSVFQPY